MHHVGDLFELNVKLRCQKVKERLCNLGGTEKELPEDDVLGLILIYLSTAIGLTPGDSSTVHIYTQTIHRITQSTKTIHRTTQLTNWEECGPCPVFASYALAFALQLRKKHGKTCRSDIIKKGIINYGLRVHLFVCYAHSLTIFLRVKPNN